MNRSTSIVGFVLLCRWFRKTRWAQVTLLFLAALATGLVIGERLMMPSPLNLRFLFTLPRLLASLAGDAVLMPAFSINSAIAGIKDNASTSIQNGT